MTDESNETPSTDTPTQEQQPQQQAPRVASTVGRIERHQ